MLRRPPLTPVSSTTRHIRHTYTAGPTVQARNISQPNISQLGKITKG